MLVALCSWQSKLRPPGGVAPVATIPEAALIALGLRPEAQASRLGEAEAEADAGLPPDFDFRVHLVEALL